MNIYDSSDDTIAALATGAAPAGVAIVRLSGKDALTCIRKMVQLPQEVPPRTALFRKVCHPSTGAALDEGLIIYFKAPHSFTGEDVVEIQCHGGLTQTSAILEAVHAAGARSAGPGEFSRRAFLNGRISLEKAEAVADMVSAETGAALDAARSQLFGTLGNAIQRMSQTLLELRAEAEALLDFPEDLELLNVPVSDFTAKAQDVADQCASLRATHRAGRAFREGVRIALAGAPNVGKSSLLNALVQEERALIDDAPGTTRDSIDVRIDIEGIPCTLVDTAGIRDEGAGKVERFGIHRAREEIRRAALTLWLVDPACPVLPDRELSRSDDGCAEGGLPPILLVENKRDLNLPRATEGIWISARSGENIDGLRREIFRRISGDSFNPSSGIVVTNRRHAELLEAAETSLRHAAENARTAPLEIFAYDIGEAARALDQITGKAVDDALLDTIFSRFCIGK